MYIQKYVKNRRMRRERGERREEKRMERKHYEVN